MGPRINHVSATARIPATTANDDPAAEHDEQRHPPCAARVRTAAYGIRQPGHGLWRPPRRKDEEDEEGVPRWKEAQGIQDQALLKAVLDFALMLAPIKSNPLN